MSGLRVLSLFDGIACAAAALKIAEIPVSKYYAVELETTKWARIIAEHNHKIIRPTNDVCDFDASVAASIGKIDLLVGGFPCQSFSRAGARGGFDDVRGTMLFEALRIIELVKPTVWLLENVVAANAMRARQNQYIGVEPVIVNSIAYGAQNRTRAFWCNKRFAVKTTTSAICIRDILLPDSHPQVAKQKRHKFMLFDKPLGRNVKVVGTIRPGKHSQGKTISLQHRVYTPDGKCRTIPAASGGGIADALVVIHPKKQKSNAKRDAGGNYYSVADASGKHYCMTSKGLGNYGEVAMDENYARRITVIEACRLQHLPDDYVPPSIPATRALGGIGNGMDAAVVADILRQVVAPNAVATQRNAKPLL